MATPHPQPTNGVWKEDAWDRVSRLSLFLTRVCDSLSESALPGESDCQHPRVLGWPSSRSSPGGSQDPACAHGLLTV